MGDILSLRRKLIEDDKEVFKILDLPDELALLIFEAFNKTDPDSYKIFLYNFALSGKTAYNFLLNNGNHLPGGKGANVAWDITIKDDFIFVVMSHPNASERHHEKPIPFTNTNYLLSLILFIIPTSVRLEIEQNISQQVKNDLTNVLFEVKSVTLGNLTLKQMDDFLSCCTEQLTTIEFGKMFNDEHMMEVFTGRPQINTIRYQSYGNCCNHVLDKIAENQKRLADIVLDGWISGECLLKYLKKDFHKRHEWITTARIVFTKEERRTFVDEYKIDLLHPTYNEQVLHYFKFRVTNAVVCLKIIRFSVEKCEKYHAILT